MKKLIKLLCIVIGLIGITGISKAGFDFIISDIVLGNGTNIITQNSTPSLNMVIKNIGDSAAILSGGSIQDFFKCDVQINNAWTPIGSPQGIASINLNPGAEIIGDVTLPEILTLTERTLNIKCTVNGSNSNQFVGGAETDISNNEKQATFYVEKVGRFDQSLDLAIAPIRSHLDASEPKSNLGGGDSIKNYIFNMISKVLVPIIVLAGIIITILGGYKMLTQNKPEELKKGFLLLIYGIVGIIIILSAKYIGNVIFSEMFSSGNAEELNGIELTIIAYQKIAYPFIKIIIYLSLGILFFILAAKSVSIITDSNGIKKAGTIIGWTAISMILIIGAKQLVESIYGSQEEVLTANATNLSEIGTAILANKDIPLLYSIINRGVGIVALVVLVLILVQTFNILLNPDKAENRSKLGKSLLRIFIGILIIGVGYLLTNALIIN